jgi:hypothetical protein
MIRRVRGLAFPFLLVLLLGVQLGCASRSLVLADGTTDRRREPIVRRGTQQSLSGVQVAMEAIGWECETASDRLSVRCSKEGLTVLFSRVFPDVVSAFSFFSLQGLPCPELEWRFDHRPSTIHLQGYCANHGARWAYLESLPIAANGTSFEEVQHRVSTWSTLVVANYFALLKFPEGPNAPTSTP